VAYLAKCFPCNFFLKAFNGKVIEAFKIAKEVFNEVSFFFILLLLGWLILAPLLGWLIFALLLGWLITRFALFLGRLLS
jgi:hypothetical protein